MSEIVFTGGSVFDGTGRESFPGEVVVRDDRIVRVLPGHSPPPEGAAVVDCAGGTVIPGLVEGHAHLTFPSAVGHVEPGFNPPVDVSFFERPPTAEEHLALAERNARILLDAGFTSAYSAGSLTPGNVEVRLRDRIAAGEVPGPRLRAASFERDNNPVRHGAEATAPAGLARFIADQAALGFDSVKLLLSNDDVFVPGGSMQTQYTAEEAAAAGAAARAAGVWLNCHAQNPESIKLAVRNGFRSVYHCSYADEEALDLLEEHKDDLFTAPAVGIMWANVHEAAEFGIDRAMADRMGSVAQLEAQTALYPEMRRRGIRVLPGGDYGFPQTPIGRNARDLQLFVDLFGYTPAEALVAATKWGGEVMGMADELGVLAPGYLADLLVVRGDPSRDVALLQDPANLIAIVQGGRFRKAPA
ncbi:hypothetical protein E1293_22435 [Actinomadura darangshiensis]|uniref:Amidohydrolase-related domain-containing protein n=1 Tax=Actinomadura darangshiensis TaxID=705336 RepID=A0A4R5B5X4_9ACTN|nr:amidohydrolase family protein [Actinomadura darangshiensis]TDD79786.1 hypothetical protein E1293_22435 [Actinomadura darangshiensis]